MLPPGWFRAGDKSYRDRVEPCREDDRDRRGCCLCRLCRNAVRGNQRHLTPNEIGCQCRQPIVLILREAVFDRHVLPLDIAGFFQA